MSEFVNIAAYKFVELDRLSERKAKLLPLCQSLNLKGTILLASEGINLFLAGTRTAIDEFLATVRAQSEFSDLEVKESMSDHQPFSRMLVRLKKEIISMGVEEIVPRKKTSPKISARELKQWLDEGRDVTLLDVRNDYEIEIGTFENAVPIRVDHFRKFPVAAGQIDDHLKSKPVVMFCTGGIRCEKAGPLMEHHGFENILQLDGGILKYFEECGGDHYSGDCFVFDKRVAVDPNLQETDAQQCYGCQAILTREEQQSEFYDPPHTCPKCYRTEQEKMTEALARRSAILQAAVDPLPGSQPYVNRRPMNVSQNFDRQPLIEFLAQINARLDRAFWMVECEAGNVVRDDQPLTAATVVRAGWRLEHLVPHTVEPDVSADVRLLYEDDGLIAVSKPAPLPMHPCGRFNRHTLQYFMRLAYPSERIRLLHRLDANTTGVVLLARKRTAAAAIQRQFENGSVEKEYIARVWGHPEWDQRCCEAPISDGPAGVRGIRQVDQDGLAATTLFDVIQINDDNSALVRCRPVTGRTNQIRIHLAHLGHPICGDADYALAGETPIGDDAAVTNNEASIQPGTLHLHALSITFDDLNGNRQTVAAPVPAWAKKSNLGTLSVSQNLAF